MSQCFVQDGALLDAFNAAESWVSVWTMGMRPCLCAVLVTWNGYNSSKIMQVENIHFPLSMDMCVLKFEIELELNQTCSRVRWVSTCLWGCGFPGHPSCWLAVWSCWLAVWESILAHKWRQPQSDVESVPPGQPRSIHSLGLSRSMPTLSFTNQSLLQHTFLLMVGLEWLDCSSFVQGGVAWFPHAFDN